MYHRLGPIIKSWIVLLSVLIATPAISEEGVTKEIPPEEVQITTPVYHPEYGAIRYPLGTYNYTVSWQGIPAADASISVEQEGLRYKVVAKAKTYSGIDIFYKLRYEAQSTLSAVDFLPLKTEIAQQENSKIKTTEIRYLENGDISTIRSQKSKETKSLTFAPGNFTLEPFSAAFIARGLNWELGKTAEFDTFNGKTRYLIQLTAVDKVSMNVNGADREVWVISPKVKKLTSSEPDKKLREAFIYMTADKEREILQIVSEVFIGSVKTKLESYTPSTHAPESSLARNNPDSNTVKLVF